MRNKRTNCGKRGLVLLGIGMLAVSLLSGCQGSQEEAGAEEEYEDLISVGFSQIGSESLWRDANSKSIQNALTRENGYFLQFNNARQKQENQIKAIRSFVSQRVDYIVLSPVTQEGWETVLTEAKDAGIPVILVDRRIAPEYEDLYTAWVGSDSFAEGEKAGRWLEEYETQQNRESQELKIAILTGTEGASATIGRSEGFASIAKNHENWRIVAEECGDFTTAKGREAMTSVLKEHPDLDILVSQNDDMTFGALEALDQAGLKTGEGGIQVISFDAAREALKLVKEGRIQVDIECNALQGPYIEQLIRAMEAGEEIQKENPVAEEVFTIYNVEEALESRLY